MLWTKIDIQIVNLNTTLKLTVYFIIRINSIEIKKGYDLNLYFSQIILTISNHRSTIDQNLLLSNNQTNWDYINDFLESDMKLLDPLKMNN